MDVVYDYQIFSAQKYGGISRYFVELARQYSNLDDISANILAPIHTNQYARELGSPIVKGFYVPYSARGGKFVFSANRWVTERWIRKNKPDIIHQTYFFKQAPQPFPASRTVVTVYDMTRERLAEHFPKSDHEFQHKADAVKRADHIICISAKTKKDLIEITGTNPNKISIIHLGFTIGIGKKPKAQKVSTEPYLLYVGERTRYKNFTRLMKAYAQTPDLNRNFKLVCVGRNRLSPQEDQMRKELGLPNDKVVCLECTDEQLAGLYQRAQVFVYPSLYEGFGIPPLEAMSFNCPVACSNTGALPEVAGKAAEYFDPLDEHEMAKSILRVATDSDYANRLRKLGHENLQRFSWKRCAEQTLAVYRSLV